MSFIIVFASLHLNPIYNFAPSLINILILAFLLWLRMPVGPSVDVLQPEFVPLLVYCMRAICFLHHILSELIAIPKLDNL